MDDNTLDYAPAPEPMSRRRLSLIIGSAAISGIVIGGVTYVLGQPTTPAVVLGGPRPFLTTQPTQPSFPGKMPAPTTQQWQEQCPPEKPKPRQE